MNSRRLVLACSCLIFPASGCCLLFPEYEGCFPPPEATCTIVFIRENEQLCATLFPRNWKVTYDNDQGNRVTVNGANVWNNSEATINIDDAADKDKDGAIDYLQIQVYTACDPEQPPEAPFSWSEFNHPNSLGNGSTLKLTMHANGLFDQEEIPAEMETTTEKAISQVNQLTGARIESPKPAPKKKKSCCW